MERKALADTTTIKAVASAKGRDNLIAELVTRLNIELAIPRVNPVESQELDEETDKADVRMCGATKTFGLPMTGPLRFLITKRLNVFRVVVMNLNPLNEP